MKNAQKNNRMNNGPPPKKLCVRERENAKNQNKGQVNAQKVPNVKNSIPECKKYMATRTKKTSNSPLATFSASTMNCSLHNALQTSAASCQFS